MRYFIYYCEERKKKLDEKPHPVIKDLCLSTFEFNMNSVRTSVVATKSRIKKKTRVFLQEKVYNLRVEFPSRSSLQIFQAKRLQESYNYRCEPTRKSETLIWKFN